MECFVFVKAKPLQKYCPKGYRLKGVVTFAQSKGSLQKGKNRPHAWNSPLVIAIKQPFFYHIGYDNKILAIFGMLFMGHWGKVRRLTTQRPACMC